MCTVEADTHAHNAALAALRADRTQRMNSVQDFYSRQLAAERENVKTLVDALEKIAQSDGIGSYELAVIAADALAKVKE